MAALKKSVRLEGFEKGIYKRIGASPNTAGTFFYVTEHTLQAAMCKYAPRLVGQNVGRMNHQSFKCGLQIDMMVGAYSGNFPDR